MKAAIYARFSDKEKQTDKSIDDQVALCRAVCAQEGLTVVEVYADHGISGASTLNRLAVQRLMRDAKAGKFAVVVAESLDRLARDQEDIAGIYKRLKFAGIDIRTAQDALISEIHVGVKGMLGALFLKDLAQKTKRGQAGVIRDGRHNGGRSFGYEPVAGRTGELKIVPGEAETVRRIFAMYLTTSPRDVAAALNRDKVPGPRGGHWNASTIAGSRKRANGILANELYAGRIVWNRQSFVKDPDTGRRISRENPREQWMSVDAPQLRIIDQALWNKVQARRGARGHEQQRRQPTRAAYLLSGLVRCGSCGTNYNSCGRRGRMRCSRMMETGLCDNRTAVYRDDLETRVLAGIEQHLAAPELIALYVREFHAAMKEITASLGNRRRYLEKRLATTNQAIGKAVDALVHGTPSRALRDRLAELEQERDVLEAELAQAATPPVELHPKAADLYRDQVRDLKRALAQSEPESRAAAAEQIRALVDKIVVLSRGKGETPDLEIHGQLAALLSRTKERTPVGAVLVAGARFELATFRL